VDNLGFIHEKLDIKILILFILRRLPGAVDPDTLAELTFCDDGINYFDYAECLSELVDTGHVEHTEHSYKITEKGDRNGGTIESSIPYSVRKKAEKKVAQVAAAMRRNSMIKTHHSISPEGACTVELGLSDDYGQIISIQALVSGEEQAQCMEENFREKAEQLYGQIVELISEK
jgi:hypothetical protein